MKELSFGSNTLVFILAMLATQMDDSVGWCVDPPLVQIEVNQQLLDGPQKVIFFLSFFYFACLVCIYRGQPLCVH